MQSQRSFLTQGLDNTGDGGTHVINVAILMILNGTSMNILMHDDQEWNLNEYTFRPHISSVYTSSDNFGWILRMYCKAWIESLANRVNRGMWIATVTCKFQSDRPSQRHWLSGGVARGLDHWNHGATLFKPKSWAKPPAFDMESPWYLQVMWKEFGWSPILCDCVLQSLKARVRLEGNCLGCNQFYLVRWPFSIVVDLSRVNLCLKCGTVLPWDILGLCNCNASWTGPTPDPKL